MSRTAPLRRASNANLGISTDPGYWAEDAACLPHWQTFYAAADHADHRPARRRYTHPAVAKALIVCAECPVQRQCLDWALDNHERWGVLGGKTPPQRETLKRRRRG